jgi:archaetidylinositol phosphate synthase
MPDTLTDQEAGREGALTRSRKRRQGTELFCEYVFRPLAHPLVLAFAWLRVPPPAVVLAATAVGLASAAALAQGDLLAAAILLQLKTLLDNADGQLARLTGRVSALGRYLDAESDLLVDAALCAALARYTGSLTLGLVTFVALTFVLGVNFNVELLYRREHGQKAEAMPAASGLAHLLARLYGVVYDPVDRLLERFVAWRVRPAGADAAALRAYHDPLTVAVLANLGLSSQLAVFGVCLAAGYPAAYTVFIVACLALLVPLAVRRDILLRRALDRQLPVDSITTTSPESRRQTRT